MAPFTHGQNRGIHFILCATPGRRLIPCGLGASSIPSTSVFVKEHSCGVVDFSRVIHSQKITFPCRIDTRAPWPYDTKSPRGYFVAAARSRGVLRHPSSQDARDQDSGDRGT
jgi:hypothetical protein